MSNEEVKTVLTYRPERIESGSPMEYRLCKKKIANITNGVLDGTDAFTYRTELVLQGLYRWSDGSEGGAEWRDIPTAVD